MPPNRGRVRTVHGEVAESSTGCPLHLDIGALKQEQNRLEGFSVDFADIYSRKTLCVREREQDPTTMHGVNYAPRSVISAKVRLALRWRSILSEYTRVLSARSGSPEKKSVSLRCGHLSARLRRMHCKQRNGDQGRRPLEASGCHIKQKTYVLQVLQQICHGLAFAVGQRSLVDAIPRAALDGTEAGGDMAPAVDGRQAGQTRSPHLIHALQESRRTWEADPRCFLWWIARTGPRERGSSWRGSFLRDGD